MPKLPRTRTPRRSVESDSAIVDRLIAAAGSGAKILGIDPAILGGPILEDVTRGAGSGPGSAGARPTKYRNVPTEYAGRRYDSKAEAARAAELDVLQSAGAVDWWIPQVTVSLGVVENKYRIDFLVSEGGVVHAEDVKGISTAKFRRDARLWRAYGPFELWVIRKGEIEVIPPGRRRDGQRG